MKSHTIPQREAERVADDLVGPPVDSATSRAYRSAPYHLIPNRANELAPVDEARRDREIPECDGCAGFCTSCDPYDRGDFEVST